MRTTVKMPRAGDTADEVVVTELLVEPGSVVREGKPLLRVETNKAEVEVPSPVTGTLVEFLVAVDDEIATGVAIAVVEP